jgi:hypothetical protein
MDDADFEVTDLGRSRSDGLARPPTALLRRLTAPQRLKRAVFIICLLLVALTPLLAVSPDSLRAVATWLRVPTPPSPTPLPLGATTFLLANTVPWGDLEVDAHPAARLGIALQWPYANAQAPTFTLSPGQHDLVYHADPFYTLRCQVSVPAAVTDTCPLLPTANIPLFPPSGSRILDARALPSYLPVPAFVALASAIEEALTTWSGTTPMALGDHYLSATGQVAVATKSAQATLYYEVNHDAAERLPTFNGDCISLCSLSPARTQLDAEDWRLVANIIASWRYTHSDGQVVNAPASPTGSDAHALLPVTVRWMGRWSVDAPPDEALGDAPPCQVAHNILGRLGSRAASLAAATSSSWGTYVAPPAAAGCLTVIGSAMSPSGQPIGETVQVLYRFGVLLAANAGAQQAFRQMPPVSPSEQTLASRLAPPGAR